MRAHYLPLRLPVVTIIFIGSFIFLIWIVTVVTPIALVEANYQYHKILREVFKSANIKSLIMPQFRLDLRGFTSTNTTNGITIPELFIDQPVVYNIDPNDQKSYIEALKLGIAHASGTSLPGSGGLGYYFAHSSTPGFVKQLNAIFYLLGKLNKGDEIYIWREGKRVDYQVTDIQITDPKDVSFLHRKITKETIVLQTCWPPGTTQKRLLVFAELLPIK